MSSASIHRRILSSIAVGLLLSLSGCLLHHHKEQIGAPMLDDKVTTERVEAALQANGRQEFRGVQVRTQDGVVTLTGVVPNESTRTRAAQIASTVHRVRKLQNEVQVRH